MATPAGGVTLGQIAERFGGELVGPSGTLVRQVATLEHAGPTDIAFLANPKYRGQLATTRAGAVIVGERDRDATGAPRIVTRNPYAYFARVAAFLNPGPAPTPGRHPAATVAEGARVDPSAAVGPQTVIGDGAVIGPRCVIGAGAIVGDGVQIGEDSVLHARSVIYHGCVLGRRVIIHSGAVIGADGFGFAPDAGRWLKVPQIGRVVLGDDVEIGANTTIDRGAIGDTVIEEGAKIDNLVQIAHNCRIGAFTVIAGCVGIAGSTRIGRNCRLGGAAMIVGHIEIGDGIDVAGGTLVSKSIDKPGMYTSVFPFMPHRDWLRNAAHLRRLDALADSVRRIERSLKPDQEE